MSRMDVNDPGQGYPEENIRRADVFFYSDLAPMCRVFRKDTYWFHNIAETCWNIPFLKIAI